MTLPGFPSSTKYDPLTGCGDSAVLESDVGAAISITRADHTAVQLRALATKSRDPAQSRRLLAIAMVLDGSSRLEAARQTGMIARPFVIGCIATMQLGLSACYRRRRLARRRS